MAGFAAGLQGLEKHPSPVLPLADRGYGTCTIAAKAKAQRMKVVIPQEKNRVQPRAYDKGIYRLRHLVENAFLHLK